ncbi:MAG: hypothetical protein COB56_05095 [Robiginitomaculum sp.]|nr:MAG: hypothetical protein COB56_05095 [Robiginitomaculum sp.]
MRTSAFDFLSNLDTLLAVFIGAGLATGGALLAEIIQERTNRKRRERDAARFFGDILMSIDQILSFAFHSQGIGDKWGGVSIRLFKTALKEAEVYERNRERLFDILDMDLRGRIHSHFLTETFPIEALIESSEDIASIENTLGRGVKLSKKEADKLNVQLSELFEAREAGLTALKREHAKTDDLCRDMEKIAKVKFNTLVDQANSPAPTKPPTSGKTT